MDGLGSPSKHLEIRGGQLSQLQVGGVCVCGFLGRGVQEAGVRDRGRGDREEDMHHWAAHRHARGELSGSFIRAVPRGAAAMSSDFAT